MTLPLTFYRPIRILNVLSLFGSLELWHKSGDYYVEVTTWNLGVLKLGINSG